MREKKKELGEKGFRERPQKNEVAWTSLLQGGPEELGLNTSLKSLRSGASLVAQWLRIRLPMQGTRV